MRRIGLGMLAAGLLAGTALAGSPKSYQVTGPVVDVTADEITVKKGSDNWEIARTAATKAPADVKKGDKVTVYYTMTASEIEAKGTPAAKTAAPKKK
jgi:hypothetical protein